MKTLARLIVAGLVLVLAKGAGAQQRIEFTQETLSNGLRVIYAPLHNAPVVSVHVLYHVGSRDEREDRQGFAHMFEHMMFRGSAHVKPQEHMKLINSVGGDCNAYTAFDQTVYHESLPANQLELALWLEADRMASFKVSDEIFKTERNVVAEEWRRDINQPYGTLYEDFLAHAYTTHPYRWTPIGNMEHLRRARVEELQDFFNTYYVPNNAILVVAGDFEGSAARELVKKYFEWIPPTAAVPRNIPREPVQKEARSFTVTQPVPLPLVAIGYHVPAQRDADQYALTLLSSILGDGGSSRLSRVLVHGEHPVCSDIMNINATLEDPGIFGVGGLALAGKGPEVVQKGLEEVIANLVQDGVTQEELDKAKTQYRTAHVKGLQTADDLASQLGDEALVDGDANRVNTDLAAVEGLTTEDLQRVARKYLVATNSTTMVVKSSILGMLAAKAKAATEPAIMNAPVAASTRPVETRHVVFPGGYPTEPPVSKSILAAHFNQGEESVVDGVRVIVLEDHRLPMVSFGLTMRAGSHSEAVGKEGLGSMTADLLRRGTTTRTREQIDADLDSHGIWIGAYDGGDFIRVSANCMADQLDHAAEVFGDVLKHPAFAKGEFENLKNQTLSSLKVSLDEPETVAGRELSAAMYPNSPLGRLTTPRSIGGITLEDVKGYYGRVYHPTSEAFLIVSGDVTKEHALAMAEGVLKDFASAPLPIVDYTVPATPTKGRIILVDHAESKQAMIRMAMPAFDVHSGDKYAGKVIGEILSGDLDARLTRYVRAEKGLAYSVWGHFSPGRHAGTFSAGTETKLETAGAAIDAMLKVFADMTKAEVTSKELESAKSSITGSMVMRMQTIDQQADMRGQGILDGEPGDYYDRYPGNIAKVTAAEVQAVMKKYVDAGKLTAVVVAPAKVKEQLDHIAGVEVMGMR
ncbi:MAG TPA: pitrilysin family protein [Tepidisphaeraceae bacterium]|jgi:zinc protease|nr:pitrilysin family protein [Tepidisphaeraceae bacterium]